MSKETTDMEYPSPQQHLRGHEFTLTDTDLRLMSEGSLSIGGSQQQMAQEILFLRAALASEGPAEWQWRSRLKGGAWDAWENGRYGHEIPPFMEVEERRAPRTELVWVQNLKGFVEGKFPADERWNRIFLEKLDQIIDGMQPPPPETNVLPELPKLPPYSHSAFPHGFHELWTEKQMKQYARDTAAFWRNDVVEKAAQIAERYGVDPWIARDIRALAATATEGAAE